MEYFLNKSNCHKNKCMHFYNLHFLVKLKAFNYPYLIWWITIAFIKFLNIVFFFKQWILFSLKFVYQVSVNTMSNITIPFNCATISEAWALCWACLDHLTLLYFLNPRKPTTFFICNIIFLTFSNKNINSALINLKLWIGQDVQLPILQRPDFWLPPGEAVTANIGYIDFPYACLVYFRQTPINLLLHYLITYNFFSFRHFLYSYPCSSSRTPPWFHVL